MRFGFVLLLGLLLISGCAAPTTQRIKVDETANLAEAKKQNEIAFEGLLNDEFRLQKVAHDIKTKASGLCGDLVKYGVGVYVLNQDGIPEQFREAAQTLYQIGQKPKVLLVYPGSSSAEAGMQTGDEIISINNWVIPSGKDSAKLVREKSEAFFRDGKPVELKISRGSEEINLTVSPEKECAFPVVLNESDELNAFADGNNVFITRGMMRFTQDETELALVVSHEMAHNSMRHMKAKTANYLLGSILDILIAAKTGANTQGAFGKLAAASYSQEFEAEADYVGMYMMAWAEKDIDSAPGFWRRMAAAHPRGIRTGYSSSHPSTAYRLLALEETVKEIKRKQEAGAPLTPEMKKSAAEQTKPAVPASIGPDAVSSSQAIKASEAVEGTLRGKDLRTGGLAGLAKGIEIKLAFVNKAGKEITRLEGKARLYDESGKEIGSIPFRSENRIPAAGSIELTHTVYPILFPGYARLKELDQDKTGVDFTFETIEFADGTKAIK